MRKRGRRARYGGAFIGALAFLVIIAMLIAGLSKLAASHRLRVITEADYAAALDIAEAGINFEIQKINADDTTADQKSSPYSGTLAPGSFSVYCADKTTGGVWTPKTDLYIYSTGKVRKVSRTVRIAVRYTAGSSGSADYGMFGIEYLVTKGTAATINGNVGTNGYMTFSGKPTINGTVEFNGPTSDWQGKAPTGYTVVHNSEPVVWPTVDSLADAAFPGGGLTWLASNNDNALASPTITSTYISMNKGTLTFKGKAGGANYYLTGLNLGGNSDIAFDNTLGPVTIWFGPSGDSTTITIRGGAAAVQSSTSAVNACRIYVATNNDITFKGNSRFDAGVYNYNGSSSGEIVIGGNPTINGSVIGNRVTNHGNITVNTISGFFTTASTGGYYSFDGDWRLMYTDGT